VLTAAGRGIARWQGTGWQRFGAANGLITNQIAGLALDATGDLWLGGTGDGLHHWVGYEDWEAWSDVQGLPSAAIWGVHPIGDSLVLVGTENGPVRIDPRTGAARRLFSGKEWKYGQASGTGVNRDGSWWAATFSGAVLRIDSRSGHVEQIAKLPGVIPDVVEDRLGREYFQTGHGLFVREAGTGASPPRRISAVDTLLGGPQWIDAGCAAPNGDLWFVADNHMLRLRNGQWMELQIEGVSGKIGSLMAVFCSADGALWATGMQGDILRLTPQGDRLHAWRLNLPPEIHSLAPLSILVDRRGWVWLGTDQGLAVWNGQTWRHLTEESGLIWNDVNQGVLREGPDGTIWVGTSGGLAHLIRPEHVFDAAPDVAPLTVSVTGIRRGDVLYSGAQQLVLPWSDAPLRFQISSPAMRNRSELIFKCRMEGLQPDWIENQDGRAVFSGLPPGDYTFMAMAINPSLNAYSATETVHIKILPPWWRSHWFLALCGLTFLLLLVVVDRLRERQLRRRSRQLEKLVHERTQELEASREQLRVQATHDGLTGMLNRVAVLGALDVEMDRARRERGTLVVALMDLDHFKRVNDTYGHLAGDEALRSFSAAVRAAIRGYDYAGRYGGEEFLLVLTKIPRGVVEERLASLHASVSNLQIHAQEAEFSITCSMGATVFDPSEGNPGAKSLLATADLAMYAAKAAGRNRVVLRNAKDVAFKPESPAAS
jgi:diguanylate cyclase (GGDEF)-like protein